MTWNDTQRSTLRTLLANMIGERDRTKEMGETWRITPELVPSDMFFERDVLDALLWCRENNLPPNRQNLSLALLNAKSDYSEENIYQLFDNLINERTLDGNITSLVYTLHASLTQKHRVKVADQIKTLFEDERLSGEDAYIQASDLFSQLSPRRKNFYLQSIDSVFDDWLAQQQEHTQASREGKVLGPRLPWKSTWDSIEYLKQGEMMTIAAKSGYGKTTIGILTARYIAHEIGGYDVVYVLLETSPKVILNRIIAGELMIPSQDIDRGYYLDNDGHRIYLDTAQGKLKVDIDNVKKYLVERNRTHGHLYLYHAPGSSLEVMEHDIQKAKLIAEANGRKLAVIFDYFNEIASNHYSKDAYAGKNILASKLKAFTEDLDLYTIVLSQDDPNSETGNMGLKVRESANLVMRSQIFMRLERDIASEDYVEPNNLNYIGNPIYRHRKDRLDSATNLRIVKANDIEINVASPIIMYNGYFCVKPATRSTGAKVNVPTFN